MDSGLSYPQPNQHKRLEIQKDIRGIVLRLYSAIGVLLYTTQGSSGCWRYGKYVSLLI